MDGEQRRGWFRTFVLGSVVGASAALAASAPTETEAVIRGSERDPTLVAGVFAFELQENATEEQAIHLAQQMTDLLSHLKYTPL